MKTASKKTSAKKSTKKMEQSLTDKAKKKFKTGKKVSFKNKENKTVKGVIKAVRTIGNSTFAYVIDKAGTMYYPSVKKITLA